MGHRFGDPEKHQANTHTGTKEHGKPAWVTEIRAGIVWPKSHKRVTAKGQIDDENEEHGHDGHVKPAHVRNQPALQFVESPCCMFAEDAPVEAEEQDQACRGEENRSVDKLRGCATL